ncbi:related to pyrimidine 5-nucleotidase [Sporisorium reilianum f. sp. reilianum]|uniref:Related to pyrimidine 5-nucleotidase n=1 Tax=Sporisorium reilianum f. sp. reilianum TaxID=72559 RepID=A0A2N8UGB0_9BASI|nr:related to pyrimidine 5-nucleotidase [Sporisorium reilianum f. sp. reilianum]
MSVGSATGEAAASSSGPSRPPATSKAATTKASTSTSSSKPTLSVHSKDAGTSSKSSSIDSPLRRPPSTSSTPPRKSAGPALKHTSVSTPGKRAAIVPSTTPSASAQDARRSSKPTSVSSSKPSTTNGSSSHTPLEQSSKHIDESTSTDDPIALTSRIGFEPRSISGLPDAHLRTNEAIVWLDIDNTLYKRSTKIADLMAERIRAYFHGMGLSEQEAKALHTTYYKTYGLAIRGLVKHHQIDPLDYDRKCDASLPLEDILQPDHQIKQLLTDIDRTRVRVFALTNAYRYHADRVLRLLDLADQVEGIVYCDYAVPDFACKPELDYYRAALLVVEATPETRNYFVDDSSLNIVAAKELGWHSCIYFREEDDDEPLPPQPPPSDADQKTAASFDITALKPKSTTTTQSSSLVGGSGFDEQAIRSEFQKLPAHLRIQLLGIILNACLPGDIAAMSKTLEKHLRLTRDVVSGLPDTVALRIFEKLPIQDLLHCRHVSKKWHSLAATPDLWRSHALALTESDPVKLVAPSDPHGWEPLVKGLFFRERNWAKGLAQTIQKLEGHSGFVTAMKLKGRKTLVSGSYDETIRVWDISTGLCRKVLRAKAIACLDFLLDEGVLCAGLYDTGRVLVWDMKSWELIQTLSGHNRGIRHVAINQHYLVSVGQDKAIVVWDWRTGAKLVRFGQQSNVSLGVSLVDTDKLVAVTVDGMIRCFSIPRREMIGQFQLTKLGGAELRLGARLGDLANGSSMLEWFAAHGNTMTVASKNVVVHLEWQEHVVPVQEASTPLTADVLRRSASSRLGNATLSPLRARRDSTMSNASATATSPSASLAARARRDSNTSTTSSTGGLGQTRAPRRSLASAASGATATPTRAGRASLGATSNFASPAASPLSTPSRPSPRTATRRVDGPAPWPLATAELETAARTSGTSTPRKMSASASTPSLSFPSTPAAEADAGESAAPEADSAATPVATRIAPDLSTAPRVVSVLDTPDLAVGCVDPTKRRIVASTRFSSRAGAERKLYASSLPFDHGKTSTQLAASPSGSDGAPAASPCAAASDEASTATATAMTVPMRGVWEAQCADLATPARNPMAMELDHESVVVGCADGLIYRIHFVGSEYGPESLVDATHNDAGTHSNGVDSKPGVGDATITDLLQLREVWAEIMVPHDQPEHPGRLRRDRLREMGLK